MYNRGRKGISNNNNSDDNNDDDDDDDDDNDNDDNEDDEDDDNNNNNNNKKNAHDRHYLRRRRFCCVSNICASPKETTSQSEILEVRQANHMPICAVFHDLVIMFYYRIFSDEYPNYCYEYDE